MKTTKHILIALMVLLSCSCKKFLDEKPTNFLTPDADLTSPKVARAFANGCYQNLQGFLQGQPSSYGGNVYNLLEFMTGKANSDLGQTGFINFQNLSYNYTSFYVDTWWQRMYLGVGACNLAIQNIPKAVQDATTTTYELAEAHALRALYYFQLVRLYGAIPKITEVPTVPTAPNLNLPRTPAKAIYDSIIIPDLLTAAKSSLPWSNNTGNVTMSMIQSLLADVYLTYAGAAINGGTQYYALSAAASKAVITNSGASLFKNYTDMNNPLNKNIGEFIFQVQYAASVPSTNPLTALTIPNYAGISKYSDEYGSVYPTPQFIQSFDPKDKRIQERQFFYTKYRKINSTDTITFRNTYIYKFFDSLAVVNTAKSDLNYTLYRLADVYLMYAEASNRAEGGPNADALKYVKAIRDRANLGPLPAGMSQTAFEQEVWLQRYYELCFENKMWFDMIRTRKVHNDVTGNWDNFVGHKTVFNATFAEKNLLFPVPKQEIDVNPNLLPNNPGF
ncbi:RagB/SusD family nutrient uptake outer membrane protein [Chitinophaga polysaccharea]|uniref:RagB/SusD family nutrient uptake outer membrane protein n=1 Tax=Chitinophaga TaxID=79328 RepID=UPI00145591E5|nr:MULTISPECIES: RagB/SusD family nutrient uptake outer membrane protein [Chitinophaga]NLR59475.1 RagB/SusD family nutrient uptake outer membrane protein [Chitinophaga polysaccharea]NLU96109.1 RagB/SusD family nutrient uptake outer membrane protein [Chitinophaga sp. Ak27]